MTSHPYFSTEQGSGFSSPRPSIRPIGASDNQLEGTQLQITLYKRCDLNSATGITAASNGSGGSRFLVIPMPRSGPSDPASLFWKPARMFSSFVPTFGICNGYRGTGTSGPSS